MCARRAWLRQEVRSDRSSRFARCTIAPASAVGVRIYRRTVLPLSRRHRRLFRRALKHARPVHVYACGDTSSHLHTSCIGNMQPNRVMTTICPHVKRQMRFRFQVQAPTSSCAFRRLVQYHDAHQPGVHILGIAYHNNRPLHAA